MNHDSDHTQFQSILAAIGERDINNPKKHGRDHHGAAFSIWMAGGGVQPGIVYGKTDDYAYNIVDDKVHVHDFHATIMHLLGIDHEKLTYRFQGRRFRITDVHGHVVVPPRLLFDSGIRR